MSEQVDKILYDFKQALGQKAFYAFDLLSKHIERPSARALVLEELNRMVRSFGEEPSDSTIPLKGVEEALNNEILSAHKAGDMVRVMEIEDDLTALRRVKFLMERESS